MMAAMTMNYLGKYLTLSRFITTQSKMDLIADKLELFYKKYNRYPCPARGDYLPTDANYGKEEPDCITLCPATMTCASCSPNRLHSIALP